MHLILTGATGIVGSSVLAHILSLPPSTSISRLSILSRSPVPLATSPNRRNTTTQIEVINHTDYNSYPSELLEKLKGAHGVVWAQGISQNEVDKNTYVKITKEYPLAAAKSFSNLNAGSGKPFNFVYVSGEGATLSPGMFTPIFGRVKGETEKALLEMSKSDEYKLLRPYSARPGAVDGSSQPEIWEPMKQRRSMWWNLMMYVLMPPIRMLYKDGHAPTPELGKALTELAMGDGKPLDGVGIEGEGRTIRNVGLRRLAGL